MSSISDAIKMLLINTPSECKQMSKYLDLDKL